MCTKHYLCIANAWVLYDILKLPCRNLSLYKSLLDSRSKDTYISWHEENGTCPFSNSTHTYLIIKFIIVWPTLFFFLILALSPGTGEPGGLPSVGAHRVGHNWSDLAAAAATPIPVFLQMQYGICWWRCVLPSPNSCFPTVCGFQHLNEILFIHRCHFIEL